MFVRKLCDGKHYVVCGRGRHVTGRYGGKRKVKSVFRLHYNSTSAAVAVRVGDLIFPKEFAGRRVRLRVEIVPKIVVKESEISEAPISSDKAGYLEQTGAKSTK